MGLKHLDLPMCLIVSLIFFGCEIEYCGFGQKAMSYFGNDVVVEKPVQIIWLCFWKLKLNVA